MAYGATWRHTLIKDETPHEWETGLDPTLFCLFCAVGFFFNIYRIFSLSSPEGQDPSKITLIGHSLGAHIAGIAGKQVFEISGQKVGRITGLDPAGPCFSTIGSDGKLDASDAAYVDVIHTNGGMLGLKESVGKFFGGSVVEKL